MSLLLRTSPPKRHLMAGAALLAACALSACGPIVQNGTPLSEIAAENAIQAQAHYQLMPGDQLDVQHILDPDYTAVVAVAPDGSITVPGISQQIVAGGQTLDQLTATLNELYRSNHVLNRPYFSLSLRSSANMQAFVTGEVERPGYLDLSGGNRHVLQAIASAGGFLPTAKRSEVIVVRSRPGGTQQIFSVDMMKVVRGTDLAQNVMMQPLDVVIVPRSDIAVFDNWIDQYIRQALPLSSSASLTYTNNPSASFLK